MRAAAAGDALPTPRVGEGLWLLAGFLVLSVGAHAIAFYLFQVVYPPPVALTPPPAEVSLLDLSKPANDGLRRWIHAQDSALIFQSREAVPPALLVFPYQPSYAGVHSMPKTLAGDTVPVVAPPARDPAAVIRDAAAPARPLAGAAAPEHLGVVFSGALAARAYQADWRMQPMTAPQGQTNTILEPARFLIAVTDKGEVRYAFLQSSSGDTGMDDLAEANFANVRFAPGAAPLTWGLASFYWASDAYR